MTRNPETTEAARLTAALTEKQKEIVCNASAAGMFNSGRVAGLQIAKHIVQAVLAVSPAVTEGARAGLFSPECPHHFDCDGIKCQPGEGVDKKVWEAGHAAGYHVRRHEDYDDRTPPPIAVTSERRTCRYDALCTLPDEHDGLHYDASDGIAWGDDGQLWEPRPTATAVTGQDERAPVHLDLSTTGEVVARCGARGPSTGDRDRATCPACLAVPATAVTAAEDERTLAWCAVCETPVWRAVAGDDGWAPGSLGPWWHREGPRPHDHDATPAVPAAPNLLAGYSGADTDAGQVTGAAGEERPGRGSRGVTASPAGKPVVAAVPADPNSED